MLKILCKLYTPRIKKVLYGDKICQMFFYI